MCVQVLDKYGDIYGRERIAELLGMDLASLDVSAMTHEKKPEPDSSMFSWYSTLLNTIVLVLYVFFSLHVLMPFLAS